MKPMKMKCVIIDNYDSFTYNLSHLIKEVGGEVTIFHNDEFQLRELECFDKIVLSPGPGLPSQAGELLNVIRYYAGRKPILGVCLGHQAIAEVFGARLEHLSDVFHGVSTEIVQSVNTPLFSGIKNPIVVGRYHSWVVSKVDFPDCLEIIAESANGKIMALRHRNYNIYGIQFHPESVLTPDGNEIISNWLSL